MSIRSCGLVLAALVWGAAPLGAQEATERFIPIGQSPGVSGLSAYVGEVVAVDAARQTVTVRGPAGERTVAVTGRTRIWLDRSAMRQPNLTGAFADIEVGRRIEVKYEDAERRERADWIKVAVPASD
jgi:hypothetical protein